MIDTKKERFAIAIAGLMIGLIAVVLTRLGNPANMGFCIACFLRDISGALGLPGAAAPQSSGLCLASL